MRVLVCISLVTSEMEHIFTFVSCAHVYWPLSIFFFGVSV